MSDHHQCTLAPNQAPPLLTFLADFAQGLQAATEISAIYTKILQAFSHIVQTSSIVLWTADPTTTRYRRHHSVDSNEKAALEFFDSRWLTPAWESLPEVLYREDVSRSYGKYQSAVERLFGICRCNAIISLKHANNAVGLCAVNMESCTCLSDPTVVGLLKLTGRLAASALHGFMAEQYLVHHQIFLQRADRLRLLETHGVALCHQIRNPLTSIKTFLQLAPERHGDARFIQEFSRLAIQDVHRIEQLLQEMTHYARSENSPAAEVDVNELVASCASFMSVTAAPRGIQIQTTLSHLLPAVWLDRQAMKQAIMSVLFNAIEASRNTDIAMRTMATCRSDGERCVSIEVQDAGCGIATEHLEHIFDPFFTTKTSDNEAELRGLGLTIARWIVRQHDGDITVESTTNVGSTFRISFPVSVHQIAAS